MERAGRSRLSPTSSPTHGRIALASSDPHLEYLHTKYIFYTFCTHICGELVREKVSRDQVPKLHASAKVEIVSDPSRYPGQLPPASAAEVAQFWHKCDAVCRAEGPGDDPLGWVRQWMIGCIVQQFIMAEELPRIRKTNVKAQWRAEVNTMMATNVKANVQNGPRPGVLGRARLLDWIGSSFSTLDADGHEVVYLVEDGGTTVSKGPFFLLHHRNSGQLTQVSADEFEQMVKGLDIPNLRDDELE